ncbi:hypothetical protein 05601_35 [Lactococcus phage 05601]|uniref:Uncharacterized protein n=1 Tax=Lactococcus phage 05601 TaxID=2029658 RepID=A0A343JNK4_9CAUD|nr:hypothetical protein HYP24_gp35 [Lactococcus phage 05601]ASZ71077.1 hypothetical protein 05601_35 [Lactococcus phage 05601]
MAGYACNIEYYMAWRKHLMKFTQYIKWISGEVAKYKHHDSSQEGIIRILERDVNFSTVEATGAEDKNGNEIAYFDKHIQLITGEEEMKKATKEEVVEEIFNEVAVVGCDIEDVLDALEEKGYIKFKKEPKKYKIFVKLVTIGEENKKLYYVNEHHLTDNIDEAKRFGFNEDKYGYAYEYVKEY